MASASFNTSSTFDLSYFDVNMDKFGKLWKKTEIIRENQNDPEMKRKLPLEEIIEHVKEAKSAPKPKKVRHFLPKWQIGRPWLSYNIQRGMWCPLCVKHEAKISHPILSRQIMDG